MVGRSLNERLTDSDAAMTQVATASQMISVRTSMSRKNAPMRPLRSSAWSVKLMEPASISSMSTTSSGNEW